MSLPQHTWDLIRLDPRFAAAGHRAQQTFLAAARKATWNIGYEHSNKAGAMFIKALDAAFGPHPAVMQQPKKQRTRR